MTARKSTADLVRPVVPWTDAEREALRGLWAQRDPELTAAQIGVEIGRRRGQVIGMARRMKLLPRESPLASSSTTRVARNGKKLNGPRTGRPIRPSEPKKKTPAPKPDTPRSTRPEPPRILVAFPPADDAHVAARNAAVQRRGCDRPLWNDRERPTHRYCGAATGGATYCAGCRVRLYQRVA